MKRAVLVSFALLVGCGKSDAAPDTSIKGTLAVEIRMAVDVTLVPGGDVTLAFGDGDFGVVDAGTKLSARVLVERLPEAGTTMYNAVFAAPKRSGSPCGDQPMTLALSLIRRGENDRVGGGLTAYCGSGVTSGTPARILRLSGSLPLPKP